MADQVPSEARKMMEKAIEAMKASIAEARKDGKHSPLVGAVLIKPDGTIDTAHRGELREGDHAEFTLLERKNRATKLDGSRLFATLEPCAPGCRKHPKLSCSERIINARIKEVWVGIEDPDPTVDRKGIKHLQENGVTVHMFDRDLQQQIRDANKDFIAQALERKAAAEEEAKKPVVLSPLEKHVAETVISDLSDEALLQYQQRANLPADPDHKPLVRVMKQQGLMVEEGNQTVPSGFGLLLFGKSPRNLLPQAGLLGTIHYADGREEPKDFDGPMVLVPEEAIQWLRNKLPDPIDRSDARRTGVNDRFFELVREGIVNALVHRDYSIQGAKCQLVVTPETIVIKSPGMPVEPITLAQLQSFNAPMLSRNPVFHYVFAKMELAEERGLGLKSMKDRATELGLPLPQYTVEEPYLTLTLFRSPSGILSVVLPRVFDRLSDDAKSTFSFVAKHDQVSNREVMQAMDYDERKAQRVLSELLRAALLFRTGRGRSTRYKLASDLLRQNG